jgi:hypothetical protein
VNVSKEKVRRLLGTVDERSGGHHAS